MRALFVAGAHTDVGKTHVACALIEAARAQGLSVEAVKPVVSGFDDSDWTQSDPGRLLTALGRPHSQSALDAISPWRYRAPLAPPMASALEGVWIDDAEVADYCRARLRSSTADLTIVEGVGGVMSPLSDTGTGLDLMRGLGIPSVLVGGTYLGAISHNLTAVETLRAHGMEPLALVLSQGAETDGPSLHGSLKATLRFLTIPIITAPRSAETGWAAGALRSLVARSDRVQRTPGPGPGEDGHPDHG